MKNPWLGIPLADNEALMLLPNVGQAQLLSNIVASALEELVPTSVAVLASWLGNALKIRTNTGSWRYDKLGRVGALLVPTRHSGSPASRLSLYSISQFGA